MSNHPPRVTETTGRPVSVRAAMEPPQRVEIVVTTRTLLVLLAFGLLVALAVVSLGTLLSIFVAAVIALGLDPLVGALVRRGWGRGRAALAVFAALFASVFTLVLVTAGPLWDQIVEFIDVAARLLGRAHAEAGLPGPDLDGERRRDRFATR